MAQETLTVVFTLKSGVEKKVTLLLEEGASPQEVWSELNEKFYKLNYFTTSDFWVRGEDISFVEPIF